MTEQELKYPLLGFKPLVVESFRKVRCEGVEYKRRLRISKFNAYMIDEVLGTYIGGNGCLTRFVVLDLADIKNACKILGIEFKNVNTYFDIDVKACSFSEVP